MKPSRPPAPANTAPRPKGEGAPHDPPESASSSASTGIRTKALHDEISRVAQELWTRYGRPQGRDEAIRREAERQVLGADPEIARVPDGPVSAADLREANAAALKKNQGEHQPKPAKDDE